MGSSGGSGSSIIAAWAVARAKFAGRGQVSDQRQAALDAEELREVEYAEMGLPVPRVARAEEPRRRGRFARLLGRR
jgi:hypothetical protein